MHLFQTQRCATFKRMCTRTATKILSRHLHWQGQIVTCLVEASY